MSPFHCGLSIYYFFNEIARLTIKMKNVNVIFQHFMSFFIFRVFFQIVRSSSSAYEYAKRQYFRVLTYIIYGP